MLIAFFFVLLWSNIYLSMSISRLHVIKASVLCAAALIWASGCKNNEADDATTAAMPRNFASSSDSVKVKMLLDHNVSLDSLAQYVCLAAAGEIKNVNITDFGQIDAYIYTHRGEKDYEVYALAFDECRKSLPLTSKLTLYKKNALQDPDKIGYQLGLEYVNDVMDKKLTIGKIDKEVAEFRKACGADEDTYKRFLKGFSVGLSTRASGEIQDDILVQYGQR